MSSSPKIFSNTKTCSVCILSILRVVAIHKLSTVDLSYTSALDGIWSILGK